MLLHYVPRTRSVRPRWLLEELGVPYELKRLDPKKGETHTPEHKALQPMGHVPVLTTKDGSLFESAALCLHLADLHPEQKLIGPVGSHARGLAYQWSFYAMTEVEPAVMKFLAEKNRKDAAPDAARLAELKAKVAEIAAPLEQILASKEWILGEFSVVEVVLGGTIIWASRTGALDAPPNVKAWVDRMTARPSWTRATAD